MSLLKRGLRSVKVNGAEYQWTIRKKPTYLQGAFEGSMNLAVQLKCEGERTALIVDLRVSRPDNWINPHQTTVTPAIVKKIISLAINDGWNPNSLGGTFKYTYRITRNRCSVQIL